jgi:DnaJ-class molecular chaperone
MVAISRLVTLSLLGLIIFTSSLANA